MSATNYPPSAGVVQAFAVTPASAPPPPRPSPAAPFSSTAPASQQGAVDVAIVSVSNPSSQGSPVKIFQKAGNPAAADAFLKEQDFPEGLRRTLVDSLSSVPLRYFVIDDSASMTANDGTVLAVIGEEKVKAVNCSRWTELTTAMRFHLNLVHIAQAPSEFRLLNGTNPIRLGYNRSSNSSNHSSTNNNSSGGEEEECYQRLLRHLDEVPTGTTPLCRHIHDIIADLQQYVPKLRQQGARAVITIATDGLASDGDIADAMRPLRDLPVLVVLRLCTSEKRVVDFWNNIDQQLELNMDVIDDVVGEAKEVHRWNPWLTYGEQLHRLREFGVNAKDLDLLDEAKLSPEQIRRVCHMIYGGNLNDYPNMEADLDGFCALIQSRNGVTPQPFCFLRQTRCCWVDVATLRAKYMKGCGCIIS